MSREQDLRVAEILGWSFWKEQRGEYLLDLVWMPNEKDPYMQSRDWEAQKSRYQKIDIGEFKLSNCVNPNVLPPFTTDPSADYTVLEWVREHPEIIFPFGNTLRETYDHELLDFWMIYEPGDYSRALLAIKDKGLL